MCQLLLSKIEDTWRTTCVNCDFITGTVVIEGHITFCIAFFRYIVNFFGKIVCNPRVEEWRTVLHDIAFLQSHVISICLLLNKLVCVC